MHIDVLINAILPHVPFQSKHDAQIFINQYQQDDQIALISAMYLGRSHLHATKINSDYLSGLTSGEIDRFWEKDTVPVNEIARVLWEKGQNLKTYYDAFIRCTSGSGYNRNQY